MKAIFDCIDGHTCGNPVRLVANGAPELKGQSMIEKRAYFQQHYDWMRRGLMFEPRGHDMMSGSMLYKPADPQNDVAVLFIETSGCLPMCGHGTIGTITMAIEENLILPKTKGVVRMETPAGLVMVSYTQKGKKVNTVTFTNVPSFLLHENLKIKSPHLGHITVDIAYGGNFYAIVDTQPGVNDMEGYSADELIVMSRPLRLAINEKLTIEHPLFPQIKGCSHIMWTGHPKKENSTARNAVYYGDKAIDRSPCGTGTSARMAQWFAKGKLALGDSFVHESIIGSQFVGRVENVATVGSFNGIIPSITGWAKKYGRNNIVIDTDDDPFALGFQVM